MKHSHLLLEYIQEAKPVQNGVYNVFLILRKFLEEHNIMFVGVAGTLLGSVMYHDFIPWDDDMDFAISARSMQELRALIAPDPALFIRNIFGDIKVTTQYLERLNILQFLPGGGGSIDLILYGTDSELAFITNNIPITFKQDTILIPKNYMGFIINSYKKISHKAYIKNHRRFRGKSAPEFYMSWKKVNKLLDVHFSGDFSDHI